ncbi:HAD family hydrolase [Amycolatopsis magusensis]|uniref:Beta-phosphoglucomutase-like phosphatase (HAD superfamily) n=1 Tax=Amycolatopsis magusensis TaxID=882444 RepID=A0ABS4PMT4_9PSEU|nr:HAD hydrolase-like protein [Amycolatopsis magusensis]MBP2180174.1 beta-phosphoglucomutase-like phosphatase (HAD superfamily) [Amycolatopsis magusensis]
MTTGDEAKARELLANAKALLLDFDGPICSVFAGLPAPTVAEQLRVVLADGGHTDLPESVATTGDPFDVFRHAATLGDDEARYVEAAFTALEVEAIHTATPTPGAHDLIHAWHRSGRPLAIVSNNSVNAVEAYGSMHKISEYIGFISARSSHNPQALKPNSELIALALSQLASHRHEAVLIDDSVTDIEAAQGAKVPIIAFANKKTKTAALSTRGPNALVTSLHEILGLQAAPTIPGNTINTNSLWL